MGDGDYMRRGMYYITPRQMKRIRLAVDSSNTTRTVMGGFEKITYKEVVNGVTIIRTRWRQKKKKERRRRS